MIHSFNVHYDCPLIVVFIQLVYEQDRNRTKRSTKNFTRFEPHVFMFFRIINSYHFLFFCEEGKILDRTGSTDLPSHLVKQFVQKLINIQIKLIKLILRAIQFTSMNFATGPSYSIKGSGRKAINQLAGEQYSSPGPMYNTFALGKKSKSVAYGMGTSRRAQLNYPIEKTPAPNQYQTDNPQTSIKNTFPRSKRPQTLNLNPDPAFYQPNTQKIKPKILDFNIGTRYPSIMDDHLANPGSNNPGPGQYQSIQNKLGDTRKTKFGSSKRFSYQKQYSPGPGDYQVTSTYRFNKTNSNFTKGERPPLKISQTPAPNAYAQYTFVDINNSKNAGKTLGPRIKTAFNQGNLTNNAFGKYDIAADPEIQHRTRPLGKIGKDPRIKSSRQICPGVAKYNIGRYQYKESGRAFIDTAQYIQYRPSRENPGPGAYQISQMQTTKYTIPKAKSGRINNQTPGVGRYGINNNVQKKKGWSMGTSDRTNFVSKIAAGVGDYNILGNAKGAISIPKAKREREIEKLPGPGDYHIQSTVANTNYYSKYVS